MPQSIMPPNNGGWEITLQPSPAWLAELVEVEFPQAPERAACEVRGRMKVSAVSSIRMCWCFDRYLLELFGVCPN